MENIVSISGVVFGVVGTVVAIYFAIKNYELAKKNDSLAHVPTIDLKMSNLPPYKNPSDFSILQIKNVGSITSGNVEVLINCSWYEEMELKLKFPSENWVLQPNEEYLWKLRIPYENIAANSKIRMRAKERSAWFEIIEKL